MTSNGRGGNRYSTYAFTEQGVAMLSSVLRSKTAIKVNIQIMRAFVSMRHFMVNNASVFNHLETIEYHQLEMQQHQQETDKRIDEIFRRLDEGNAKPKQGVFYNGTTLYVKDVQGNITADHKARIQIRETIKAHFRKEAMLFKRGIKCLSLFFIDEVANYRKYDEDGNQLLGRYGEIFEKEYMAELNENQNMFNPDYMAYLGSISAHATHAGYFSIDKKGRAVNSEVKRGSDQSDDTSAYDLILKNKERLLSLDEPVRFIFSHSALREGWDNPNVFQICSLRQSNSVAQKRQEVGRGLRLCVDAHGVRQDNETIPDEVQKVNKLTVIASEGYATFVADLQKDIRQDLYDRPTKADFAPKALDDMIEDGSKTKVPENKLNDNFAKKEFQKLWKRINHKYAYTVDFDSEELIKKAVAAINRELSVTQLSYVVTRGEQKDDTTLDDMKDGSMMVQEEIGTYRMRTDMVSSVKYDLLGKIGSATKLTRKTVATILSEIMPSKFAMYKANPEEFIRKVSRLVMEQKATIIVEHISYNQVEGSFDSDIFTQEKHATIDHAFEGKKSIVDYVFIDSDGEKDFVGNIDTAKEVAVYAKLPKGFHIPTPVGNYSPDWAIAFQEGTVKHIYFVAETKGSMSSMDLREIEKGKIACAEKLFEQLSTANVKYGKVDSFDTLMDIVK